MQMLLDTELKQISMGAIQQFNLDVIQCECEYTDIVLLIVLYVCLSVCARVGSTESDEQWLQAAGSIFIDYLDTVTDPVQS